MKRLLSTVMILSLLLSQVLIAQAADSAKASTLRLERTVGTVSLTNQSAKSLFCLDGMKLLSGYTLSTKAASYAYVSLDENKAVKLDGLSAASVKQKGKKLELLLSSGKLFFDVKVPLASDETMEIRTSTMVTGIRGTAGVAQVLSPSESTLFLLSGHVQTTSFDPVSRQVSTVEIQAGQLAHFTMHAGNPQPQVRITPLQISDIPGFAAMEIAGSPSLQAQIRNQTTLDLTALIAGAAKQLSDDEAAELERTRLANAAIAAQISLHSTNPLFPVIISSGGGDGSRTPPQPPSTVTLTSPKTAGEIQAELDKPTITTVILSGTGTSTLEQALTIPPTKTLCLANNAAMEINDTQPLTINGTLSVQQSARLKNNAQTVTTPGIIINSKDSLDIAGFLENNGLIQVGTVEQLNQEEIIKSGKLSILPGGNASNSGTIDIKKGSILESTSSFKSTGMVQNFGEISYISGLFLMKAVEGAGKSPAVKMEYKRQDGNDTITSVMYADNLANILQNVPTETTLTIPYNPDVSIPIGDNPRLSPDKKLILNFNGKTIDLDNHQLVNEGDLTLIGDYESNIELSGQSNDALIKNSGTLILTGCNLESSGLGPVIESLTNPSASLSLTGNSQVTGNSSTAVISVSSGSFSISQNSTAKVINTNEDLSATNAYALKLSNGVIATMNSGEIISMLGGLLLIDGASFTMEGGLIQTSSSSPNVFAVNNMPASNFNFNGGTVQALQSLSVCANPPQDYENSTSATNSWFSLVHK